MKTVSRLGLRDREIGDIEATALGGGDDPRNQSLAALHMELDAAVEDAGTGYPLDLSGQPLCKGALRRRQLSR